MTMLKHIVLLGVAFAGVSTAASVSPRATGGYVQNSSGQASFTKYTGCNQPACGKAGSGFTAAISQLAFGSAPGLGPGDACGRCFAVTASGDPYSPNYSGPFKTIVVKVTDLCPVQGNQDWCGQSRSNGVNRFGAPVHFDLCQDNGAAAAFFPSDRGALTGTYTEVSCSQWSGSVGGDLWQGACLASNPPNWPSVGCGNKGTAP